METFWIVNIVIEKQYAKRWSLENFQKQNPTDSKSMIHSEFTTNRMQKVGEKTFRK